MHEDRKHLKGGNVVRNMKRETSVQKDTLGHPVGMMGWGSNVLERPLLSGPRENLTSPLSASPVGCFRSLLVLQPLASGLYHRGWQPLSGIGGGRSYHMLKGKTQSVRSRERRPGGLHSDMFLREHYSLVSRQESLWLALPLWWTVDRSPKLTLVLLNHLWLVLLTRK